MLPRIPWAWGAILILSAVVLGQFGLARYKSAKFSAQTAKIAQIENALKASESARKRLEHSLAHRESLRASTARKTALAEQSLTAALAVSTDWASEPVPEAVRAALGVQ